MMNGADAAAGAQGAHSLANNPALAEEPPIQRQAGATEIVPNGDPAVGSPRNAPTNGSPRSVARQTASSPPGSTPAPMTVEEEAAVANSAEVRNEVVANRGNVNTVMQQRNLTHPETKELLISMSLNGPVGTMLLLGEKVGDVHDQTGVPRDQVEKIALWTVAEPQLRARNTSEQTIADRIGVPLATVEAFAQERGLR